MAIEGGRGGGGGGRGMFHYRVLIKGGRFRGVMYSGSFPIVP